MLQIKLLQFFEKRLRKRMLRIIVPDYAKSAGTLIALAAEKL